MQTIKEFIIEIFYQKKNIIFDNNSCLFFIKSHSTDIAILKSLTLVRKEIDLINYDIYQIDIEIRK